MNDCPELKEKLTDSEISRNKREAIEFADSRKEKGCSATLDEMHDRQRTSTRKSFYFKMP
jgi:hypothetical protein